MPNSSPLFDKSVARARIAQGFDVNQRKGPMIDQLAAPFADPVAESDPLQPSGSDCRVYQRHACGLTSSCQPAGTFGKDDLKWSGTIDNISIGGVGLILSRRFEKGTGLAIELPGCANSSPYVVLAKVIHVQKHGRASWMLGCQFVSELSEDEVNRLLPVSNSTNAALMAAEATPLPCLRTELSPSLSARPPTATPKSHPVQLTVEFGAGKTIGCMIPDFEALNCPWPLAAGTVGSLKGVNCQGEPWKLRVKVHHCSSDGGNWTLECRLAKKTSEAQLLNAFRALLLTR